MKFVTMFVTFIAAGEAGDVFCHTMTERTASTRTQCGQR